MAVDHHVAAIDLKLQGLQAHVLDIGVDADGDDSHVRLEGLGLAVRVDLGLHAGRGLGQRGDLGADAELDPALFVGLAGDSGDLLVLDREDARQGFDHRDLRTQGAVEAGELHADGAGADHEEGLRRDLGDHGFAISPDLIAVRHETHSRYDPRPRAGGEDHRLGRDPPFAAGG